MEIRGTVAIVTGGAGGIGRALARRLADEGARGVVVADLDEAGARAVAAELGERGHGAGCDVADEEQLSALIERAERRFGPVDLFCANAGIADGGGLEAGDELWRRVMDVNVWAHLRAARLMFPRWAERGGGHLLVTASAAGLLTQLGSAPYSVSKHAAVALAEWLAITHRDQGIRVSCVCPMTVNTPMISPGGRDGPPLPVLSDVLEPEQVAAAAVEGVRAERFLILPHPDVREHARRRAGDHDRWLRGMRRLQERQAADQPGADRSS